MTARRGAKAADLAVTIANLVGALLRVAYYPEIVHHVFDVDGFAGRTRVGHGSGQKAGLAGRLRERDKPGKERVLAVMNKLLRMRFGVLKH